MVESIYEQNMVDISGKKLLIVDDEPDLREVLTMQFEQIGFNVVEAGNGIEAIEVLKREQVDGVLTDIRMPKMDGVKLLESIRSELKSDVGLVFVTGFADIAEPEAFALGASGFIKKPYDRGELAKVVHSMFVSDIERLSRELGSAPTVSFDLDSLELDPKGMSSRVSLGKGGFFLSLPVNEVPAMGELVKFSFGFSSGPLEKLTGEGIIRWSRTDSNSEVVSGIGVEIFKLSESCTEAFRTFTQSLDSIAYIPNGNGDS